ncbi:MAG: methionyl-tRNA formyltransferase [Candidatus Aenigmarchaeota archaeon]|nr:methionyl-tRNA formyltransferase [Candidatus Aenigmarchaeota archaeon]
MKIIIIGPTLLTRKCIEALIRHDEEIAAIYTLDDSMAWEKSRFAIMDDIAEKHDIRLFKVRDINACNVVEQIRGMQPDVIFELGWSQIISKEMLEIPKKGCIGVHASLLPKNRGAASLNWAIIRGDRNTGVTLFYLAAKPDDGDIIAQKEFDIDDRDDISTLHSKSDIASAELLLENIDAIRNGTVKRIRQDPNMVTFTQRRNPEDGVINWNSGSREIYNWVRAQTHPFPGAFTFWKGEKLYVWQSEVQALNGCSPGTILKIESKRGIHVCTNDGVLLIKRAQLENDVEMWADDLAEKRGIKAGGILG